MIDQIDAAGARRAVRGRNWDMAQFGAEVPHWARPHDHPKRVAAMRGVAG